MFQINSPSFSNAGDKLKKIGYDFEFHHPALKKDFMSKGDNTGVNTSKCKSTQFSIDVTVAMLVLGLRTICFF